ncbi:MAG: hypothetical protein Q9191_000223 [Dirinaria sp. TL-2023a]
MDSHFTKRFTQVNLKHSQAPSLVSNDVSSVSGNPSSSKNTRDSSNTHNDIAVKSKRNRTYPDKEGDERIVSSADRKRLTSKRPAVEQDTGKAESSPPSGLHSFSQSASAERTSRKNGATEKLNEKASFKTKKESSWRSYDEGYNLRVSELVTVAKKKRSNSGVAKRHSASEVVAVKKLSDSSRNISLSMLLRVQGEYFVRCTNAYEFEAELYVVLEHMSISLIQVVAAPVHPKETHVTSIMLSGIKFLESKDLVHDDITCSSVLLNDDGEVKISMQERCTIMSKEIKRGHSDVQAVEDIMRQLLGKREGAAANDLRRWSSTAEEFSSKIMSASAEELLQVSEFALFR